MRTFTLLLFVLGCSIHHQNNQSLNSLKINQAYKSKGCEIVLYEDSVFIMNCFLNHYFSYGRWEIDSENSILLNSDYLPFENSSKRVRDVFRVSGGFTHFNNAQILILSDELIEMQPSTNNEKKMRFTKINEISNEISKYRSHVKEMEKGVSR